MENILVLIYGSFIARAIVKANARELTLPHSSVHTVNSDRIENSMSISKNFIQKNMCISKNYK